MIERVPYLKELIRDIPDWPSPGVVFKDITPLLADARAFAFVVDNLAEPFDGEGVAKVIGVEARGFVLAAPLARRFDAGFVPVRKPGKLPWEIEREEYELEYGSNLLEIHRDAVAPGERVVVCDDVLATGGTAEATVRLVERLGGEVVGLTFLLELGFLGGRSKLEGYELHTMLTYEA
ncbi:MAG TPA: adenine phosphoribosyltransferase [Acidimicrobiia bacterium]|nr:adenine phosphoribosyltransferase [Acidimicrobiia bacterium]